jgi:hypothetical protein
MRAAYKWQTVLAAWVANTRSTSMNLNLNTTNRQTVIMGVFLIALGVVWWLNLWSLLLPAAMIVAGVVGYLQRRSAGRKDEAIQAALWGIGMGLLFLAGFVWPGVLFIAGASILLRGREAQVEASVRQAITRVRPNRASRSAERVPVETTPVTIIPINQSGSSVGDTTRLNK